jgi:hypothetical protein
MNKPITADIIIAIAKVGIGDYPVDEPIHWFCVLYTPDGKYAGNGAGYTAAQAMAMAWIDVWAPDALIDAYVELGSVPFDVPDGWRFELTPPWQAKKDYGDGAELWVPE